MANRRGALPLAMVFFGGLLVFGCSVREVSYNPEIIQSADGGIAHYSLNCLKGDLNICNSSAAQHCAQADKNAWVTNHFVMGSKVQRINFYCTTGPAQMTPKSITFNEGSG